MEKPIGQEKDRIIWINQEKHKPEYDPWELNVTIESSTMEVGTFCIWTEERHRTIVSKIWNLHKKEKKKKKQYKHQKET
jgi:hypothetical protein